MLDIRCLRACTTRVPAESTWEKNQLCKYSEEHRKKFESRRGPESRPSRCQPSVDIGKKSEKSKISNRDLARVGPAYRCQSVPGMLGDGLSPFGSIWKHRIRGNDRNASWGNRKIALCRFKIQRLRCLGRDILYDWLEIRTPSAPTNAPRAGSSKTYGCLFQSVIVLTDYCLLLNHMKRAELLIKNRTCKFSQLT